MLSLKHVSLQIETCQCGYVLIGLLFHSIHHFWLPGTHMDDRIAAILREVPKQEKVAFITRVAGSPLLTQAHTILCLILARLGMPGHPPLSSPSPIWENFTSIHLLRRKAFLRLVIYCRLFCLVYSTLAVAACISLGRVITTLPVMISASSLNIRSMVAMSFWL